MEFGKNENDSKYIYFDSDDDFYKFCVVPEIKAKPFALDNGETFYTMDFDLSNDYNMAIQNGNIFVIKDENSQIYKHGCVSYRTISKPIQNLEPYDKFEEQYKLKKNGNK